MQWTLEVWNWKQEKKSFTISSDWNKQRHQIDSTLKIYPTNDFHTHTQGIIEPHCFSAVFEHCTKSEKIPKPVYASSPNLPHSTAPLPPPCLAEPRRLHWLGKPTTALYVPPISGLGLHQWRTSSSEINSSRRQPTITVAVKFDYGPN